MPSRPTSAERAPLSFLPPERLGPLFVGMAAERGWINGRQFQRWAGLTDKRDRYNSRGRIGYLLAEDRDGWWLATVSPTTAHLDALDGEVPGVGCRFQLKTDGGYWLDARTAPPHVVSWNEIRLAYAYTRLDPAAAKRLVRWLLTRPQREMREAGLRLTALVGGAR